MEVRPLGAEELTFLAQDESVEIFPLFHHPTLEFFSGSYGPFRPGRPTDVPLWLALKLRSLNRCSISRPSCLRSDFLDEALEAERQSPTALTELPFFIFELARIFIQIDNGRDIDDVLGKLEDLRRTRLEKLRRGRAMLKNHVAILEMPNLTAGEAAEASLTVVPLFNAVRQLDPSAAVPHADTAAGVAARLGAGRTYDDLEDDYDPLDTPDRNTTTTAATSAAVGRPAAAAGDYTGAAHAESAEADAFALVGGTPPRRPRGPAGYGDDHDDDGAAGGLRSVPHTAPRGTAGRSVTPPRAAWESAATASGVAAAHAHSGTAAGAHVATAQSSAAAGPSDAATAPRRRADSTDPDNADSDDSRPRKRRRRAVDLNR